MKLNFSRGVLFHTNTKVFLTYFGQDFSITYSNNRSAGYIRHIAHFINFWEKAINIYVNKVHSSFFKNILFIPAQIFYKATYIIVNALSRKNTIMKQKYVKQIFIWNSMNWPWINIYIPTEYKQNLAKTPIPV